MGQIRDLQKECHEIAYDHGFWDDSPHNAGEKIALMHSELSECLEWMRKDPYGKSDHIPEFTGVAEELADCVIRIMDFCQWKGIDLEDVIKAKMEFNRSRPYKHGKKF